MAAITMMTALLTSGCDSNQPRGETWHPFIRDLESTVAAYPDRGIVIVFGTATSEISMQNREEVGNMADRLPEVVFIYADATQGDSGAAQVLKEQGGSVPFNLVYDSNSKSWDVLPNVVNSTTRKEVYMQASFSIRRAKGNSAKPNKAEISSPITPRVD